MTTPTVKSVRRTLAVLELFDRTKRAMNLTEVAEELEIPTSSAQELLRSLVTLGYLSFDRRTRLYFPTLRVTVLGEWIETALFGQGHYKALLKDIRNETGESVGIGSDSDLHVQFLQILTGTFPLTVNWKAGDKDWLCTSAMGRILLSQRPKPFVDRLLRRHNSVVEDESQRVSQQELDEALQFIEQHGYARSRSSTPHGLGSISMLLPNTPRDRPIALGVSGPADRISEREKHIVDLIVAGFRNYF